MTLYEILYAAQTGGAVSDADLRRAVVAFDNLETLTGFAIRDDPAAVLARATRLKRALAQDPRDWLGPGRDPMDPAVQDRYQRLAGSVDAWFKKAASDG